MTRHFAIAALALALPGAAFALPAIGDIVGTNPADATKTLTDAGCPPTKFEAEHGKVEVNCTETASGRRYEFYLDPKTGAVTRIKAK